jgi:hypothetical protein
MKRGRKEGRRRGALIWTKLTSSVASIEESSIEDSSIEDSSIEDSSIE